MDLHTNYEDFDDMENPEDFTESQGIPSEEQHVNGMCVHTYFQSESVCPLYNDLLLLFYSGKSARGTFMPTTIKPNQEHNETGSRIQFGFVRRGIRDVKSDRIVHKIVS